MKLPHSKIEAECVEYCQRLLKEVRALNITAKTEDLVQIAYSDGILKGIHYVLQAQDASHALHTAGEPHSKLQ